jgi:beta-galactosidase
MRMISFYHKITLLFLIPMAAVSAFAQQPREKLLLDFNWKFHLGDDWPNALHLDKAGASDGPAAIDFNDSSWRTLNLPHDWAIELPFDNNADASHGFKPIGPGYPNNSIGWYRRTFELPAEDSGKRIWLDFDGVFQHATVWVNGWLVTQHDGGYYPFHCDITDIVRFGGKNVITVEADASRFEGWFYEGAGIYRHVWLEKTSPVAIAPDGIFVWSEFKNNVPAGPATLHIETRLLNSQTNEVNAKIICEFFGPAGNEAGKSEGSASADAGGETASKQTASIKVPLLWSPENPQLYKLVTTVKAGGEVVDQKETVFGIRTVAFDANKGFLLNGQPYELKGTCNHQDMAGVGSALPDALQYFRVKKLKEFGCNAIRTSHNPPTPELLEACDRLGMIVMDENRLLGSDAENMEKWDVQIRRDRNHPSVCIWSIANEEFTVQDTSQAANVARTMQDYIKRLDATRPVTYAAPEGNVFQGINSVIQVRGWNYFIGGSADKEKYHAEHPDQPNVGTEQGSTVSTRGIYANDSMHGYVSAYDDNAPPWAQTAEYWWSYFATRPWLSGGFVWTGFDYRGEPTPYAWPCINSHFGILDTCGFPKDNFYYYQSWWTTNIVLHLLPHWNWPGKEGQAIRVDALSNCKTVELFLNGTSLGRQTMQPNSRLTWQVKYAPGTLSAKGFDDAGKVIAETKVETTGGATQIQLTPNRSAINADGEDVSVFTVSALDAQGRVVPVAQNRINFSLEGVGKILGVGNGDPSCHEPDTYVSQAVIKVIPFNDWRWKLINDFAKRRHAELVSNVDDSVWGKTSSAGDSMQLTEGQHAVFRQHLDLSAAQLASEDIQIHLGRIDDLGWVYVNGQCVGESHDWTSPSSFNIQKYLHTGDNIIAVGVQNIGGAGGIGHGVNIQTENQIDAVWSRSLFNGYAEVIVQSTKEAGKIKLTASADGLQPAATTIQTQPTVLRPSVP